MPLAYDGPITDMDPTAGYVIAILSEPKDAEIRVLHNNGIQIALICESGDDPVLDAQREYKRARMLRVSKETTIFAVLSEPEEDIHRYYSVYAGVLEGNGFTPGLCAGSDVIDSMIEPGYRGVWWQDNVGVAVSPFSHLHRVDTVSSEVTGQFPVWGPQNIPPPKKKR